MWYPISYMWTNPSALIDHGSGRSILRTEIWCILFQQICNPLSYCSIIAFTNFKVFSIVRTWDICEFIEFDFIKTNWKNMFDKISLLEGNTMSKAFKIFQYCWQFYYELERFILTFRIYISTFHQASHSSLPGRAHGIASSYEAQRDWRRDIQYVQTYKRKVDKLNKL